MRSEAEAWREIAERIDENRGLRLYAALGNRWPGALWSAMDARLRTYDNPAWCYGPDDAYYALDADDSILAALWLALDAESESAVSLLPGEET